MKPRGAVLWFCVAAWTAAVCGALSAAERPPALNLQVLEKIAFEYHGHKILIPVRQGTNLFHFALDTGAALTGFDKVFLPDLGPPLATGLVQFAWNEKGTNTPIPLHLAPELHIGRIRLNTDTPVMVFDLEAMRRMSGTKVSGIIGMGFMKDYSVAIDFDRREISFGHAQDAGGKRLSAPRLPTLAAIESPSLMLLLPSGEKERFFFDTGDNGAGSLRPDAFDNLVRRGFVSDLKHGIPVTAPSGKATMSKGTVWQSVSILGLEHRGVRLLRGDPSRLGMEVIEKHNLIFDFPRGLIYQWPRESAVRNSTPGTTPTPPIKNK